MLRSATTTLCRQAGKISKKGHLTKTLSVQKRHSGSGFHNHPPAEHPYLGDNDPLYTKWAYSRITPNSTYGDKHQHPMNYQGHVPVTPTSFSGDLNPDGTYPYIFSRYPNLPWTYAIASVISTFATFALSVELTTKLIFYHDGYYFPRISWDLYEVEYWKNFIKLQGYQRYPKLFTEDKTKNIYQTEEFKLRLEEYLDLKKRFEQQQPKPSADLV